MKLDTGFAKCLEPPMLKRPPATSAGGRPGYPRALSYTASVRLSIRGNSGSSGAAADVGGHPDRREPRQGVRVVAGGGVPGRPTRAGRTCRRFPTAIVTYCAPPTV